MPEEPETGQLLGHAKELERTYDWSGAARAYERLLQVTPQSDPRRMGELSEEVGRCHFKSAMQARNLDECRERLEESKRSYKEALDLLRKSGDLNAEPRACRCEAILSYLGFWTTTEVARKRRSCSEAWSFATKAMAGFEAKQAPAEVVRTFNELFLSAMLSVHFSGDPKVRESILRDVLSYGERISNLAVDAVGSADMAGALVRTAGCREFLSMAVPHDFEMIASNQKKSAEDWQRALRLSEEVALLEKTDADLAYGIDWITGVTAKGARATCERQLEHARRNGSRLAIGTTLGCLANALQWESGGVDDPDEFNLVLDKALALVEEARASLQAIGFMTPDYFSSIWPSSSTFPHLYSLRSWHEPDLARRIALAKKAVKEAETEFALAEKAGYPYVLGGAHFILSFALAKLAQYEPDKEKKRGLLERADAHSKESIRSEDAMYPSHPWNHGLLRCLQAEVELTLAGTIDDKDSKKRALGSSIDRFREGIGMHVKAEAFPLFGRHFDETAFMARGYSLVNLAHALRMRHDITGQKEDLVSAASTYAQAAHYYDKAGLTTRVAESHWEAAKVFGALEDHMKASELLRKLRGITKEQQRRSRD